jgi:hypothetical protein
MAQYAWATWIGLLPLLVAIRLFTPRWAGLAGGLWGLSVLVFVQLLPGAEAPLPLNPSKTLMFSAIPAIYSGLGCFLTQRLGFRTLLLALGWIWVELGLKLSGLHDGLLSPGSHNQAITRLIGGVLGYGFVGFFIVFAGVFLLDLACTVHFHIVRLKTYSPFHEIILASWPDKILLEACSIILQPAKPRAPPLVRNFI